ncbi:MAG: isocitrate/isopropylmalate dehydrogenase family protein [Candidatus Thermoplasmatota archaeon]
MTKYDIAWMPGDGIGKDVSEAARTVLDAVGLDAHYVHADVGWECWVREGDALPQRTIDTLRATDCAFFGAITSKPKAEAEKELSPELRGKGFSYRSPIVRMRQLLDLYICMRPIKAYPGNPLNHKEGIDMVVFRENTEDLYVGVEFYPVPEEMLKIKGMERVPRDAAISLKVNTPKGCERIVRAAFDFARQHKRKKVTCVHKANVVRVTDGLFLQTARDVAKEYQEIQFDNANVDSFCMWALKNPHNYDVLVAPNLYGDIISDLCVQMVGGLGFGASGNIGTDYAVFEPTHGSAPKYTGQYKVNPIAAILAGKMMLDWLGEKEMGERVERAVAAVVKEGKVRTYDMGGTSSTLDVAEAIAQNVQEGT